MTRQADVFSEHVIIFDLDGTLVDSAPDLCNAMNHVLQMEGLKALPLETVRHCIGDGAKALLLEGFNRQGAPLDDTHAATLLPSFMAYYTAHLTDLTRPFPNCVDTLAYLKSHNARLAVCTNKMTQFAMPILQRLHLSDFFDAVICRDTLAACKPAAAPLYACLEQTNSRHGIMVGDTMTDYRAGLAARMPTVLATFGYGILAPVTRKTAQFFADFCELPKTLEGLCMNGTSVKMHE